MYVALDRLEILHSHRHCGIVRRSGRWRSSSEKCADCWGFSQNEWVYSRQGVPKYLDVHGDSDWAGVEERKTLVHWSCRDLWGSSARRCVGAAVTGRAVKRGGAVLRLQTAGPRVDGKRATS